MTTIITQDGKYTVFDVKARMKSRWVPHFLGLLKMMQNYGGLGCSRMLSFYSDGDGDFRPRFEWADGLPEPADPIRNDDGNATFDAG